MSTRLVLAILAYLATIVGANYLTSRYGFVPVGFGLMATAGTYCAGFALSARDLVHTQGGRHVTVVVIVLGAGLSWFVSPAFAVASGVAFLVSELADMAVYSPLRHTRPYLAVTLSNTVGGVIDTWLFLWLAFGSLAFWEGNVVGKLWTVVPVVLIMKGTRAVSERLHPSPLAA